MLPAAYQAPAAAFLIAGGFLSCFFGYRLFDWLTPGDAQHKIFEEGNVAVAVMKGAFVLAIAIVLAAVIAA